MAVAPILVVDDDPAILELVLQILIMEGYTVATASNGAEALAALPSLEPCLLILDINMPVLDGYGVARSLQEQGTAIPILVMTAGDSARKAAEEIGAAGYLDKPFSLDDLLDGVERACQQ